MMRFFFFKYLFVIYVDQGLIYNFEIFHMREKNVPLDTLEVKGKRQKRK